MFIWSFFQREKVSKVLFQAQKWSSLGLIFMILGLPDKLGTLLLQSLLNSSLPAGCDKPPRQSRSPGNQLTQYLLAVNQFTQYLLGVNQFT